MLGSPLRTAYYSLLSAGRLKADAGQALLVEELGNLQLELNTNTWQRLQRTTLPRNGVYIYGGVGTGKSRIADLFAATLPSHITHRRTHFFEFMTDVHTRLHHARSRVDYDGDPLLKIGHDIQTESSVLCLDEFQVSDIVDAMMLKRLFGSFWHYGGVIVSTSNRHPSDLYKNGLNRSLFVPFINDLQRRCTVFSMDGKHDYRMDAPRRDRSQDVFFTDVEQFQKSILEVVDSRHFKTVQIPVAMGRVLKINASSPVHKSASPRASNSKMVVSTTFSALCETSVGASDFHALCSFASLIYMSGLRQFESRELDVVRRFVTLVDVAYEARTRVICLSTHSMLKSFEKVMLNESQELTQENQGSPTSRSQDLMIKREGGSSSSMMSTFIDNVEWSATGLMGASLATSGAGETDVRFAIARALSRLSEMSSDDYGREHQ